MPAWLCYTSYQVKDCQYEIEVVTHILANGRVPGKDCAAFHRDSLNHIIFQESWFFSAYSKGIELANIRGIKAGDIHTNLVIDAPTGFYKRYFEEGDYRVHEAIFPGTRVKFEAVVRDHVTQPELEGILERVGKFVGLSPFGYNLGFGKFVLIAVSVAPSDAAKLGKRR